MKKRQRGPSKLFCVTSTSHSFQNRPGLSCHWNIVIASFIWMNCMDGGTTEHGSEGLLWVVYQWLLYLHWYPSILIVFIPYEDDGHVTEVNITVYV